MIFLNNELSLGEIPSFPLMTRPLSFESNLFK